MRVLVVEDDAVIADFLARGLAEAGHQVHRSERGDEGQFLAETERWDALILDRMLPGRDGMAILDALRAAGNDVPALVLSSLGDVEHRVQGLRAGADDYLAKPFALVELLARLDALVRRREGATREITKLRVADLEMDLLRRTVRRGARVVELQPREFRLLEYLMRHAGQVVTRTMLLEAVWDYHFDPQTNVIDVHISRLRGKIDRGEPQPLLQTVRGSGYLLGER
ncbi:MAG TPA: response regulator transcription factor [Xanthomonadales bacterium]|nr:response regulator transcription factor [Xanthomonadales bacterium]